MSQVDLPNLHSLHQKLDCCSKYCTPAAFSCLAVAELTVLTLSLHLQAEAALAAEVGEDLVAAEVGVDLVVVWTRVEEGGSGAEEVPVEGVVGVGV